VKYGIHAKALEYKVECHINKNVYSYSSSDCDVINYDSVANLFVGFASCGLMNSLEKLKLIPTQN